MLQSITQASTMPLLQQIAKFSEKRQEVLAGNIAGIDTPDYKSRDLPVQSFHEALSRAARQLKSPQSPYPNQYTSSLFPIELPTSPLSRETATDKVAAEFSDDLFRASPIPESELGLQDRGKRGIEYEMREMTKTLMIQNYAMQMMQAQFDLLEAVIAERP